MNLTTIRYPAEVFVPELLIGSVKVRSQSAVAVVRDNADADGVAWQGAGHADSG